MSLCGGGCGRGGGREEDRRQECVLGRERMISAVVEGGLQVKDSIRGEGRKKNE